MDAFHWQYSLVSLGIVILILLIQHVCECTQSSINPSKLSFRLRHHFWTWAGSRPNYLSSIVPLVYPTYPSLIRATASDPLFWKSKFLYYLSIESFRCSIIWCPCILLPLVEYRCSHQIPCGPSVPLLDFIRQCPSYWITLWVLSLIHNAFSKLYPLVLTPMLYFRACIIYSEVCGISS